MMYLRPGRRWSRKSKHSSKEVSAKRYENVQEEEYQRFIDNEAPSDVGTKDFADFQVM